jgi:hypothetical protein
MITGLVVTPACICVLYRLETVQLSIERFGNQIHGDTNELTQAIRDLIQEFNKCHEVISGRKFHVHLTGVYEN